MHREWDGSISSLFSSIEDTYGRHQPLKIKNAWYHIAFVHAYTDRNVSLAISNRLRKIGYRLLCMCPQTDLRLLLISQGHFFYNVTPTRAHLELWGASDLYILQIPPFLPAQFNGSLRLCLAGLLQPSRNAAAWPLSLISIMYTLEYFFQSSDLLPWHTYTSLNHSYMYCLFPRSRLFARIAELWDMTLLVITSSRHCNRCKPCPSYTSTAIWHHKLGLRFQCFR